jgi:hypothetical protein
MMSIKTLFRRAKRKAEAKACRHPEEDRIPAGTMGHPFRWICRRCGHRSEA